MAHVARTENTENTDLRIQKTESKCCGSTENSAEMERSRRELFPAYFIFSDSNSKSFFFASQVSDKSENVVIFMIFYDIRVVFDDIQCCICPSSSEK